MSRTLLVTNDFPPRPGGIQQFVHNLAVRQPAGSLVVYASTWQGAAEFDAEQPFEVVRERHRRAAADARPSPAGPPSSPAAHGCDTRLVRRGRAARPARRRAAPPGRHRAGGRADPRPRGRLGGAARRPAAAAPHRPRRRRGHLPGRVPAGPARPRAARADRPASGWRPGVDVDAFHPGVDGAAVRAAARPGRPAGDRLRVPAGAAQGPGHADPGAAGDPPPGAGRGAAARRRRPVPVDAGALARADGRRARRGLHRLGAVGGAARALRGRRRLRDAVPHPPAAASTSRASASSTWRRPRPGCRWSPATPAARRTRSARARPATSSAAATSAALADRLADAAGRPGPRGAGWARPAGPGSSASGAGTPGRPAGGAAGRDADQVDPGIESTWS